MKKIAKEIHTILCDDIRTEIGNKVSLMGVYAEDIILNKIPFVFPHLCLAIFIRGLKEKFSKLRVTFKVPNGKPVEIFSEIPPSASEGSNFKMLIQISPVKIEEAGQAEFELRFDDAAKPNATHKFMIKQKEKD